MYASTGSYPGGRMIFHGPTTQTSTFHALASCPCRRPCARQPSPHPSFSRRAQSASQLPSPRVPPGLR